MGEQGAGGISWTGVTWNPIRGCRRKNKDCTNCYAERLAATRLATSPKYIGLATMTVDGPRWTGQVRLDEADLLLPLRWQRPRLVFVNAMSDLFYEELTTDQIDRVVMVMAMATRHTFQVLTKRPERMATYLNDPELPGRLGQLFMDGWPIEAHLGDHAVIDWPRPDMPALVKWPLVNVWWGASMGHRAAVKELMPALATCRRQAAVLWVSAEPLIEDTWDYLDFTPWLWKTCTRCNGSMSVPVPGGGAPCPTCLDHQGSEPAGIIDWMVAGGESGQDARPTNLKVARQLRDDSVAAGVAFYWKQWGEWLRVTHYSIGQHYLADNGLIYELEHEDLRHNVGGYMMARIGRKAAGRLLDGKLWDEWPKGITPAGKAA